MIRCIYLYGLIFLYLWATNGKAQALNAHQYPKIGKHCPDFVLKNIDHYPIRVADLKALRSQPLVLDFFTTSCLGCWRSMPKLDSLQKKFRGRVQFLLVGKDDLKRDYRYVKDQYEKFRSRFNLDVPVAYDSFLYNRFVPEGVPHLIWIYPNGIVAAITSSDDLNVQNVQAFIEGRPFKFTNRSYEVVSQFPYDYRRPLGVGGNGGVSDTGFLYRSLLAEENRPGVKIRIPGILSEAATVHKKIEMTRVRLESIYTLAYTGVGALMYGMDAYDEFAPHLIIETTDTAAFQKRYSYSLIVPPDKTHPAYLQRRMQRDLEDFFGYQVSIEKRKVPCWKLRALDGAAARLKTKGGPYAIEGGNSSTGFSATNIPVKDLLMLIWNIHQDREKFVNETGIDWNIDITMKGRMLDFDEVKKALKQNGLELVPGAVESKVIVLRSAPHQASEDL